MLPVGIGDAIRARRERAGLTQEALGALLAVHPDLIDDWEWGDAAPDPRQARRLAAILGLSASAFLPPVPAPDASEAVVVYLVPAAGGAVRPTWAPPPAEPGPLVAVPPRPLHPPPGHAGLIPGQTTLGTTATGPRTAVAARAATPSSRWWSRRAVAGMVAALLVTVAASSGVSAFRQGQMAARYEAEARALRTTLVVLAGERDRLAARLADLAAALTEAGVAADGTTAWASP